MAWSIWTQRNQLCLCQTAPTLHLVEQLSRDRLCEFHACQASPLPCHQPRAKIRWVPPPRDLVKINFDGAVFASENKAGIGVVLRNSSSLVIASWSQILPQAYSVEEIEALAAAKALSFAAEIGVSRAVLEGDSLVVIKALSDESVSLAPFGLLVEDVKVLFQCFSQLLYSHTKREGNSVAHSLARYAIDIPNFSVWMEDVPPQFFHVL